MSCVFAQKSGCYVMRKNLARFCCPRPEKVGIWKAQGRNSSVEDNLVFVRGESQSWEVGIIKICVESNVKFVESKFPLFWKNTQNVHP